MLAGLRWQYGWDVRRTLAERPERPNYQEHAVQRQFTGNHADGEGLSAGGKEMTISEKKNVFRRMLETIAEGRSRQAQRYIDSYRASHDLTKANADEAFLRRQG